MPLSKIGQFVMRISGGRSILCDVVEDLLVEARGALPWASRCRLSRERAVCGSERRVGDDQPELKEESP
jgi:hypothetical protein